MLDAHWAAMLSPFIGVSTWALSFSTFQNYDFCLENQIRSGACPSSISLMLFSVVLCSICWTPIWPTVLPPSWWPLPAAHTHSQARWTAAERFNMKSNQLYDTTAVCDKMVTWSRLNEQGNEVNEWKRFTLKSLINLSSHQPLSSYHLCHCIAVLLRTQCSGQFIQWPYVPGAINPVSCPKALTRVCPYVCHASISTVPFLTYSPSISSPSIGLFFTPFAFRDTCDRFPLCQQSLAA